jgi:hypothetical protein
VPVPKSFGNGDDEQRKRCERFFRNSFEWKQVVLRWENPAPAVLERVVFHRAARDVYLIADAYRCREIKQSIEDFFSAAAGE